MKKILFGACLGALLIVGIAAVRDEAGNTIRYRLGTVLSFDPQVTVKDEDGAWTFNAANLSKLTNISATTISATTNQITFGATNTAPADTNVVLWVSVRVSGDTNAYRLGLTK